MPTARLATKSNSA